MPNNNQQPNKDAAALAFATMLSEQLLKQQNPMQEIPQEEQPLDLEEPVEEAPQTSETAPESEETLEVEEEEPSFVADLKSMITEGFENIKGLFKKEEELEPKE